MGLIIITSIDYGTEGSRLLDHRTGKTLTEGVGRKLYLMHIFCAVKTSDILIGKIDAGTASKVKKALIFTEFLHAQPVTDLHQCIITGILNGFPYGLHAMTVNIVTVDPGICDELITVTVKSIIRINRTCLNGR